MTGFLCWLRNGRTIEHRLVASVQPPAAGTLEARLAAVISFYRWQQAVFDVPVAGRLLRGAPRRAPARALLAHLDARSAPSPSSLVRVRRHRQSGRPPLLLPREIQAILDGCAVQDRVSGEWVGNLRDRLLFALLAETGCRLGEVLGLRVRDFVMGRGGTPYVEIVPREDNPNGARVKMMRPRRVYVGSDLERLFADYLTELACRAAEWGVAVTAESPLLVNLQILTGRRASEIRTCEFDCLSPVPDAPAGSDGGEVVRFRYAQSKIDIAPDTILVDRDVSAVIEEQQQWMRDQFPDITPRYLFTQRFCNLAHTKPYSAGTYRRWLAQFSDLVAITDSKGRPVQLSHTHRFRHTRLTRLEMGRIAFDASFSSFREPSRAGVPCQLEIHDHHVAARRHPA